MTDTPQFSQAEVNRLVQEAVVKREEQLRTAFKTDTLEGRVGELTRSVNKIADQVDENHQSTLKKLDEVNHFKQYVNERITKTETLVNTRFDETESKMRTSMAAHVGSPQHTLFVEHLQIPHLKPTLQEVIEIQELLHDKEVRDANKKSHNIFQKQLELRVTSLYGILGITTIAAPAILWLVTHLTLH